MDSKVIIDGISEMYDKLEQWIEGAIQMLPNLLSALVVVILFVGLSRYVHRLALRLFDKTEFNRSIENLLASVAKISTILVGLMIALSILNLEKAVFSLLAGVGVIGLALGFAFQDLASNFISGIMLALRSPIRIGDVVKIGDVQGSVINIRLRDTLIRNFDGQDVIIPNKDFTTNKLINYSTYGMRKLRIDVGIGYEDDPTKGVEIVRKALEDVPGILHDPAPEAYVGGLGASSVDLFGHIWFTYPGGSYFQIQNDAIIGVKKSLEEAGFNIPFPIRTIDLNEGTQKALESFKS